MKVSRGVVALVVGVLVLSACGEATPQYEAQARQIVPGQSDEPIEVVETETLEAKLEAIAQECATSDMQDLSGELLDSRIFRGPPLRCVNLSGAEMVGVNAGNTIADTVTEAGRVDFSGANFTNIDLHDSVLSIIAVGADFSGADLRGVDFTDSDLRGAKFIGALLEGSSMTSYPDGMALADLSEARLGCNMLVAAHGINLSGVVVEDECADGSQYQWRSMTLAGDLEDAILNGLDFEFVTVTATNFRSASMRSVDISDKGVFPDRADFTSADLTSANLSGTGFHDVIFENATLTAADLSGTYFSRVNATGANFSDVDMTDFQDFASFFVEVEFATSLLNDAYFEGSSFAGADLRSVERVRLVLDGVTCPSSKNSKDGLGGCNFRDDPAVLLAEATEG